MPKPPPTRPAPRLYLETAVITDPANAKPHLTAALQIADIAAVLVRLHANDERTQINRIKSLAPVIQPANAALLLDGHADIAVRAGADGVHVDGVNQLQETVAQLHPHRIVGVGGLYSRHDSMVAGETGADYLLFGRPGPDGHRPPAEDIAEQIGWWAELFEPPCVGYASALSEVEAFADAGADFVMLGDVIWDDPRGHKAALEDATKALDRGYRSWLARMAPKPG